MILEHKILDHTQEEEKLRRSSNPSVKIKEREVTITRTFDAERELVYLAWADPKKLAKWWGPKGSTNPVCETDVRKDGAYRIVMRTADGSEYPMKGVYKEVEPNEKLSFTVDLEEHPKKWKEILDLNLTIKENPSSLKAMLTATFEDEEGKTKLAITSRYASDEVRDAYIKTGMVEGWTESLERLEEQLNLE